MLALVASLSAYAQNYQSPNSTVGVSVGTPWLVSVRGEAWFADEASFELGVGALGRAESQVGLDWALRWRPDFACLGCESRALVTFGLGVGGTVQSDLSFDGGAAFDDPWGFAVGPDLAATFAWWLSPTMGLTLGARGGVGAAWAGSDLDVIEPGSWAFLTGGLAF